MAPMRSVEVAVQASIVFLISGSASVIEPLPPWLLMTTAVFFSRCAAFSMLLNFSRNAST